jgi:hypothetical protein
MFGKPERHISKISPRKPEAIKVKPLQGSQVKRPAEVAQAAPAATPTKQNAAPIRPVQKIKIRNGQ